MSKIIDISDVTAIDLTRHGFIEASAGTGKTYTLEHLVLRLLTEPPTGQEALTIEQILVVTFTEKAAGELKQRIQEKLAAELVKEPPGSDRGRRLRDNLARFDHCAIGTIHGFCQRLLQDFAFENNTLFENRLVDDRTVYRQALTDMMRHQWPLRYGEDLADLLTLSGLSKNLETLTQTVLTQTRRYHPWLGDRILPASPDHDYPQLNDRFQSQVETIKTLLAAHPDPVTAFGRLNFHAGSRRAQTDKIVQPLTDWILSLSHTPPRPVDFLPVWERFTTYDPLKKGGLNAVWPIKKWNKGGDNTAQVFPQLPQITKALKALIEIFDRLQALLVTQTIINLQQAAGRAKRRNGWISYDDMLNQVHQALHGPTGGLLLDHLRQSFPYAFVDEFQDTDPVQWSIFKTIYIDAPQARGRLFLIGDPKQAIYAFRGADVFVYLEARRQFAKQVAGGGACRYRLNHNFRSSPELIEQFNRLFGYQGWFDTPQSGIEGRITYMPAQSPPPTRQIHQTVADRRAAVNVVDLMPAAGRMRQARMHLSYFMAAEIAYLMGPQGPKVSTDDPHGTRRLEYADIGVLVRGRGDAAPIEEALSQARIPYAFYRKQGLFDTAEAFHLSRVLRVLASPGDTRALKQALLTPFFEAALPDMAEMSELPFDHPARLLLLQWQSLAEQRHWGRLFQALVEESGLLFRGAAANSWERSATNYRQIFVHLTEKALTEKLDLQGLCTLLNTRRTRADGDEDAPDTQEIETELSKVQIMTLHMSKGLQFPVVFIAGGLTAPPPSRGGIFHRHDGDGWVRVFDPLGHDTEKNARVESDQEDRRLYYVGLTRARQMLYLPYIDPAVKLRGKGPVLQWMAEGIKTALIDPGHCQPMAWNRPSLPAPRPDTAPEKPSTPTPPLPQPLLPPAVTYHPAGLQMTSFTRLQSQKPDHGGPGGFQPQSLIPSETDEIDTIDADWERRPELPGGPTVGTFFHVLLEKIDYARAARLPHDAQTDALIRQLMGQYGIDAAWRDTIGDIVAATLNTPITTVGANFRLADLSPAHRRHEVPFYYHFPSRAPRPETFARGSVDLIFRANDRYYVADWKSNRLPTYDQASLRMSMDQAGYHLQYRLYSLATLQWLRQVAGPDSRVQDHFGGVFYFYLRGMDTGGDQGIYFVPPEQIGSLESLEADIKAMLGKTGSVPSTEDRP